MNNKSLAKLYKTDCVNTLLGTMEADNGGYLGTSHSWFVPSGESFKILCLFFMCVLASIIVSKVIASLSLSLSLFLSGGIVLWHLKHLMQSLRSRVI